MTARAHRNGVVMCVMGILLLSPEAMIIRLLDSAHTADILFYRNTLMGLCLAAFIAHRHGWKALVLWNDFGTHGWIAIGVRTFLNMGFVVAIQTTSAANTLVILATMPAFAALLSWLMLGERVSQRNMATACIAFIGVGIIFWQSLGHGSVLGDAIALGTAVLYALYIVLVRRESLDFMIWSSCISSLLSGLLALPLSDPLAVSSHDLVLLVLLGVVVMPLAYGLLFAGARLIPPVECGLITLLETVLGPIWVWLAVHEEPSLLTVVGGAAVVGAIGVNSWHSIRMERRRPATSPVADVAS
jgi:drug/metabolite transporter (DMT)-like permease